MVNGGRIEKICGEFTIICITEGGTFVSLTGLSEVRKQRLKERNLSSVSFSSSLCKIVSLEWRQGEKKQSKPIKMPFLSRKQSCLKTGSGRTHTC